jgi:hypothetical protein
VVYICIPFFSIRQDTKYTLAKILPVIIVVRIIDDSACISHAIAFISDGRGEDEKKEWF